MGLGGLRVCQAALLAFEVAAENVLKGLERSPWELRADSG